MLSPRVGSFRTRTFHASAIQLTTVKPAQHDAITQRSAPFGAGEHCTKDSNITGWKGRNYSSKQSHDNAEAIRNEVGVQLLSPSLKSQVFRDTSFPPPERSYIQIAREHLESHKLDPSQGSMAPPISFTLPQLQGNNIDEHFYRIGATTAEPHLSLAKRFANLSPEDLPPKPDEWVHHPGWTKYNPDGSYEHVDAPLNEQMICFDVETMPPYHLFPIMACAVSHSAWYAWISPWILGITKDPKHLIPFGDPAIPRVVIGHNVSYDRARILEEYSLNKTANRFVDTMSLHVAVKGISSHQRPAWMSYRKQKKQDKEMVEESMEVVKDLVNSADSKWLSESDSGKKEEFLRLRAELEESLPHLQAASEEDNEADSAKRWESMTSANSLADVARLHCGIEMDKSARDDFMKSSPESILASLDSYLNYCASDVSTTFAVFHKVLPAFLQTCPNPVSWSGVMTMGSSFLPVNQAWEEYLQSAEGKYRELEDKIRGKLVDLARDAMKLVSTPEQYENDEWLKQLDWSPKVPGLSRGVERPKSQTKKRVKTYPHSLAISRSTLPMWYIQLTSTDALSPTQLRDIVPHLLRLSWNSFPIFYSSTSGWIYRVPENSPSTSSVQYVEPSDDVAPFSYGYKFAMLGKKPARILLGPTIGLKHLKSGTLTTHHQDLATALCQKELNKDTLRQLRTIADEVLANGPNEEDPWTSQLDWTDAPIYSPDGSPSENAQSIPQQEQVVWPKWYWELASPKNGKPPGELDLTARSRASPLLLRLRWLGWPLFHSREHGWTFRVRQSKPKTKSKSIDSPSPFGRLTPLLFTDPLDDQLQFDANSGEFVFYKLPHKDGEKANVGSPLGKTFMKYASNGTLTSPGNEAQEALDMNAQCSYWISARDRVMSQMVVWDGEATTQIGVRKDQTDRESPAVAGQKWGLILPQVTTMGTVTRRAIEKTWLTASNAKSNRVGSELKAMVKAPPGYSIVGADVDSEELWISSVMGDAQFGLHGATAIGWMTLEGTKAAGTDLHSKTAAILGISRDSAKVFNYSRIYGAGMKHAVLLLIQSNPNMPPEEAQRLAENLYASTKGKKTHRRDMFGRTFWYGGSESYVFNKLEEIALSEQPKTPALGCGVTHALSKEFLPEKFGSDYMTSRINWVVQSSGVDYLHLLIVAMEYLINKYDISARYLISVHDEVRYLVKESDKYRCALALQIANLWTRSLFAYKLGLDDLPQGVAFFSAVDVDHVLRKEVYMTCVTPSHPVPIPPGESLDMLQTLEKTGGGFLGKDQTSEPKNEDREHLQAWIAPEGYTPPDCMAHRASGPAFLRAQATTELGEVKMLAKTVTTKSAPGRRATREPRKAKTTVERPKVHEGVDAVVEGSGSRPGTTVGDWDEAYRSL